MTVKLINQRLVICSVICCVVYSGSLRRPRSCLTCVLPNSAFSCKERLLALFTWFKFYLVQSQARYVRGNIQSTLINSCSRLTNR
jgi:hypothetical protein